MSSGVLVTDVLITTSHELTVENEVSMFLNYSAFFIEVMILPGMSQMTDIPKEDRM